MIRLWSDIERHYQQLEDGSKPPGYMLRLVQQIIASRYVSGI